MKTYYFYIDEGGIFGNCTICLTNKKLKVNKTSENHISYYYFGKCDINGILRYLQMFNQLYPKCEIINHKLSNEKILLNDIKNAGAY